MMNSDNNNKNNSNIETIRAFIGLPISGQAKDSLISICDDLKSQLHLKSMRWVDPDNWHVTLKFLGQISKAHIVAINKKLQAIAANTSAFSININKLAWFPSAHHARMIVAMPVLDEQLGALYFAVESAMLELGFAGENRSYLPHATLLRFKGGNDVKAELNRPDTSILQQSNVFRLYQSLSTNMGVKYLPLYSYHLKS